MIFISCNHLKKEKILKVMPKFKINSKRIMEHLKKSKIKWKKLIKEKVEDNG
jgi:hypothetical protein